MLELNLPLCLDAVTSMVSYHTVSAKLLPHPEHKLDLLMGYSNRKEWKYPAVEPCDPSLTCWPVCVIAEMSEMEYKF